MKTKKKKLKYLIAAILILLTLGYFIAYFFSDKISLLITVPFKNVDGRIDNSIIWSAIVGISTIIVAIVAVWQSKKASNDEERRVKRQLEMALIEQEKIEITSLRDRINNVINSFDMGILKSVLKNIFSIDINNTIIKLDDIRSQTLNNQNDFYFNKGFCYDYANCSKCNKDCIAKNKSSEYKERITNFKTLFLSFCDMYVVAINETQKILNEKNNSDIENKINSVLLENNNNYLQTIDNNENRYDGILNSAHNELTLYTILRNFGFGFNEEQSKNVDAKIHSLNADIASINEAKQRGYESQIIKVRENNSKVEESMKNKFTRQTFDESWNAKVNEYNMSFGELLLKTETEYSNLRTIAIQFINTCDRELDVKIKEIINENKEDKPNARQ